MERLAGWCGGAGSMAIGYGVAVNNYAILGFGIAAFFASFLISPLQRT